MTSEHRAVGSRYVAEVRIGHGGMGEVWRGRDAVDGTSVAVKFLHAELVAQQDLVARFLREARILKALDDPRLVGIRDFVAEGPSLAIVMDLVEGPDLGAVLAKQAALGESATVRLLDEILEGLGAVHRAGVVHGDLKPSNLLMPKDGRPLVRIADFGIARIVDDSSTREFTSQIIGSPAYMAPELVQGSTPDKSSDLYAIGALAVELLTGRAPFQGGSAISVLFRQLHEQPSRPAGISDSLWRWISHMLAKEPAGRPPDAMAALAMLRTATADNSPTITIDDGHVPPSVSWGPGGADPSGRAGSRGSLGGVTVLDSRTPSDTKVLSSSGGGADAESAAELRSAMHPVSDPARPTQRTRRSRRSQLVTGLLVLVIVVQAVLLARSVLVAAPQPQQPPTATSTALPSRSATPTRPPSPGVRRTTGSLPDVVGMHVTSAEDTLASYGYLVQVRQSVDDNRPDGEVTGQEPGAGGRPSDGTVRLNVSRRSSIVWLAELTPTQGAASTGRVDLPDRSFAHGVVFGPACAEPGGVSYELNRRYTRLATVVALVAAESPETSVRYRVIVDDREAQSGQINARDRQRIQVDVDGGGRLRIEAAASTDRGGCGTSRLVLGDPRLVGLPD